MAATNDKKWYVVKAISGKEKKVKEYLDSEVKNNALLQSCVSQVLIPTEKVYSVKNGKKVTKERTYLPGYVLVEVQTELTPTIASMIRDIPNVLGFLGTKGNPDPIRKSEVDRILGKVDELMEMGEGSEVSYIVGETVIVNDGPFSSFSGTVEEVDNDKKKLKVMVKIFGRKTPLELGFFQVKRD